MIKKLLNFFSFKWIVGILVALGGIIAALFVRGCGDKDKSRHIPPSGKTVDDVKEEAEDAHEEIDDHFDDIIDSNPFRRK